MACIVGYTVQNAVSEGPVKEKNLTRLSVLQVDLIVIMKSFITNMGSSQV